MKNGKTIEEIIYQCLGVSLLNKFTRNKGILNQVNNEEDLKYNKKRLIKKAVLWSIPAILMLISAPAPSAFIATFKTIVTSIGVNGIVLQRYRWLKMNREFNLLQEQQKNKEEVKPALKIKEEEPKTTNFKALELTKENKSDKNASQKKDVISSAIKIPENKEKISTEKVLENLKSLREEFRATMNSDFEEQTFSRALSNTKKRS